MSRTPINKIFDLNAQSLLHTIKEDLRRWSTLPLSLFFILPNLTFLFYSVPMYIPKPWFANINRMFVSFLWRDKKPRINQKKLSMPRDRGGLGIPDVYLYYIAFNARYPLIWGFKKDRKKGSWDWL